MQGGMGPPGGMQGGMGPPGGMQGGMMPPGSMQGGMGMQGGAAGQEPDRPTSTLRIWTRDKTLLVAVNLIDQVVISHLVNEFLVPLAVKEKSYLDMAGGEQRIFDLAMAGHRYPQSQNPPAFPRGAADRSYPPTRMRPYEPKDRVSWMADLLPYLPLEEHRLLSIDRQQSWREGANLKVAQVLIPQFLDVKNPASSWYVEYPGLDHKVAATHFVGISGVGLDAAEYGDDDPRRGVIGYDRITRLQDISRGTSQTMFMAEVPPTFKRPWLAGGGATIQGVPEERSVEPFVSTQLDGQRGTMVLMVDGSVRFVSEKISDKVFQDMATIKGADSSVVKKETKLMAPPEDQDSKMTAPVVPAAPTAPKIKPGDGTTKPTEPPQKSQGGLRTKRTNGTRRTPRCPLHPLGPFRHLERRSLPHDSGSASRQLFLFHLCLEDRRPGHRQV
jgi:hypothetical protein